MLPAVQPVRPKAKFKPISLNQNILPERSGTPCASYSLRWIAVENALHLEEFFGGDVRLQHGVQALQLAHRNKSALRSWPRMHGEHARRWQLRPQEVEH